MLQMKHEILEGVDDFIPPSLDERTSIENHGFNDDVLVANDAQEQSKESHNNDDKCPNLDDTNVGTFVPDIPVKDEPHILVKNEPVDCFSDDLDQYNQPHNIFSDTKSNQDIQSNLKTLQERIQSRNSRIDVLMKEIIKLREENDTDQKEYFKIVVNTMNNHG